MNTSERRSLVRRGWRRRPKAARMILIDENGRRVEYVHDDTDPIFWRREGEDGFAGYLALTQTAERFLKSRSRP